MLDGKASQEHLNQPMSVSLAFSKKEIELDSTPFQSMISGVFAFALLVKMLLT